MPRWRLYAMVAAYLVVCVCVCEPWALFFLREREREREGKNEKGERALLRLMSRDTCLFPTFFSTSLSLSPLSTSSSSSSSSWRSFFFPRRPKKKKKRRRRTSVKTTFSTSAFLLFLLFVSALYTVDCTLRISFLYPNVDSNIDQVATTTCFCFGRKRRSKGIKDWTERSHSWHLICALPICAQAAESCSSSKSQHDALAQGTHNRQSTTDNLLDNLLPRSLAPIRTHHPIAHPSLHLLLHRVVRWNWNCLSSGFDFDSLFNIDPTLMPKRQTKLDFPLHCCCCRCCRRRRFLLNSFVDVDVVVVILLRGDFKSNVSIFSLSFEQNSFASCWRIQSATFTTCLSALTASSTSRTAKCLPTSSATSRTIMPRANWI